MADITSNELVGIVRLIGVLSAGQFDESETPAEGPTFGELGVHVDRVFLADENGEALGLLANEEGQLLFRAASA